MRWWQLAAVGVAVAVSLFSAGFVVLQEAGRVRERNRQICTQVTELREDVVVVLESQGVPMEQVGKVRVVSC